MNTARSFGPAAVTGFPYSKHWVVSDNPCDDSLHEADRLDSIGSSRLWDLFLGPPFILCSNSEHQVDGFLVNALIGDFF
jgi:hypothetical protein